MEAGPDVLHMLEDATKRLEGFIDSDGACDNTHEHNKTLCCVCQYPSIIAKACGTAV